MTSDVLLTGGPSRGPGYERDQDTAARGRCSHAADLPRHGRTGSPAGPPARSATALWATVLGAGLMAGGLGAGAWAAPVSFTDRASFETALMGLSGPPSIIDFDDVDAATPIVEGAPFQGIRFSTSFGPGLVVADHFQTTSGLNYLGLDDGFSNEFLSGDELRFDFVNPVRAFGLSIIAGPDDIFDADFQLVAGGGSVFNTTPPEFLFADGGQLFFLGIIDTATFDQARLISFGDRTAPFFAFNVDDVTSVPVPPTAALLGLGLLWLGVRRSARGAGPAAAG